jgi:acetyltransferase-like isoleucine patch superfamily enzyme
VDYYFSLLLEATEMLSAIKRIKEKFTLRKYLADQFTSTELRHFFTKQFAIEVGMYSYGCFDASRIARGTKIGRYCSFANTVTIFNGNHGLQFISLHPYLYNASLGCVENETINRSICIVEDDVWIGHAAIVLPQVTRIGRGAVIGAGAVVTRNVQPYSIVAGNPAKLMKYRFTPAVIAEIEKTKWWEKSVSELKDLIQCHPDMVFGPKVYFSNIKTKIDNLP